jgi:hypothetical protein
MKLSKQTLKQIIKEELSILNEEDSPMEILGVHNISDSRTLIDAVRGLLDQGGINDDNSRTIENWLSRKIRKEPDEELQAELTNLRDEMMRSTGAVGRSGQTSYERTRSRRHGARGEMGGGTPATGRMTTLQSLGIGENKMKLSKQTLKQIIKEELEAIKEGGYDPRNHWAEFATEQNISQPWEDEFLKADWSTEQVQFINDVLTQAYLKIHDELRLEGEEY